MHTFISKTCSQSIQKQITYTEIYSTMFKYITIQIPRIIMVCKKVIDHIQKIKQQNTSLIYKWV